MKFYPPDMAMRFGLSMMSHHVHAIFSHVMNMWTSHRDHRFPKEKAALNLWKPECDNNERCHYVWHAEYLDKGCVLKMIFKYAETLVLVVAEEFHSQNQSSITVSYQHFLCLRQNIKSNYSSFLQIRIG